jgi:polyisoprenyl-phosphate glycosyltransferase
LVKQLSIELEKISGNFEVILVEDGSRDDSWREISSLAQKHSWLKGVCLSRNFGQHQAIACGLNYARGEWVVVMDCDLQDRPDQIGKLLQEAQKGFHAVRGQRLRRDDKLIKRLTSKVFYMVFNFLSGQKYDSSTANFGIYHKEMIRGVRTLRERDSSFFEKLSYVGFRVTAIPVNHSKRFEGKTSYTWSKLLKFALNVAITGTNRPLMFSIKLGLGISLLAMLFAIYNIFAYFSGFITVPGFTSVIFSIWFIGGLNLFSLGVTGLYMGKTYNEVKGRPAFIVQEEINT